MDIFFSHGSAYEFWLSQRAGAYFAQCSSMPGSAPPHTEAEALEYLFPMMQAPYHVMVGDRRNQHRCQSFRLHTCSSTLAAKDFNQIKRGYHVASPELCFLQMACELNLIHLIRFGYELCGTYVLDDSEGGFGDRDEPLSSIRKLRAFLARSAGMRGHQNAQRALRYIAEGSGSPMETALCMLLSLPPLLGGYGLPKPELNHRVDPPKNIAYRDSRSFRKLDLYWSTARLAVEFESNDWHIGAQKLVDDSTRRDYLLYLGISVIPVTYGQMKNLSEMENLVRLVAKKLGRRIRRSTIDLTVARRELREMLLKKHLQ